MMTLHQRRRAAHTTHGTESHNRYWRDCANDNSAEDDALRVAKGMINALVIGAALWALLAVSVWAISFLWA